MFNRLLNIPKKQSFFLFGPRGTGKSFWLHEKFPHELYFDLLEARTFTELLAMPSRIEQRIPIQEIRDRSGYVVIDEVQKIPALLDEVHRAQINHPS